MISNGLGRNSPFVAATFAVALLLPGCQSTTSSTTPVTTVTVPATTVAVTDLEKLQGHIKVMLSTIQGLLPAIKQLESNPKYQATVGRIQTDVNTALADATALSGFSNIAEATSTAQEIVDVVNDLLTAAKTLPLPAPFPVALAVAQGLLPLVCADLGIPAPNN